MLLLICAVVAQAGVIPLVAQDRLASDIEQFQHEPDPVRKARELAKLGSRQIEQAQQLLKSDKDVDSLNTLQTYLHEVQQSYAALTEAGIDAEKKPSGYKELQISVRENMRRIDDLILTLPVDKRPFFREVRTGLVTVQNQLIDALFPRRPSQNSNKVQP